VADTTLTGLTGVTAPVVTTDTVYLVRSAASKKVTVGELSLEVLGFACSDETTALTTGTKVTFRMPFAMTATGVRLEVTTAPTAATLIVDVKESGTTIFSTKPSIDATEKTSTTGTPAAFSDTALADDAEMTIIVDQVGATIAGAGLKVFLLGYRA
jgi:hypothetical protein